MTHFTPHPQRIHLLTPGNESPTATGPVVYWMRRDQRAEDNWALFYAQDQALRLKVPLAVVFTLAPAFLGARGRAYDFMLRGLRETAGRLEALRIGFAFFQGDPADELAAFLEACRASLLVTDFFPVRPPQEWQKRMARIVSTPLVEVDAHNIVPCRHVSPKQEYAARTIRPKIQRLLPEFLTDFPEPVPHSHPSDIRLLPDWDTLIKNAGQDALLQSPPSAGTEAAHQALDSFIRRGLPHCAKERNDPNARGASGLSPYLHFGQLAPQRVALRVLETAAATEENAAVFLEELIIRRELADNFCMHNPDHDNFNGLPRWGRETLNAHRADARSHIYTRTEFEQARTHDSLWNAAQIQLVASGSMHGYLRMYWAKKILEWTPTPETALDIALQLNNAYQLDGRDPNGYVGVLWSVGGLHDRAFKERPVFGKIRYMNAAGCRRKFNTQTYIQTWLKHAPS